MVGLGIKTSSKIIIELIVFKRKQEKYQTDPLITIFDIHFID